MNPMAEWLLPTGLQISALNAAVASLVACAGALAICRIGRWSLPVRHGIFVAALATCLVAPALSMIVPWPSLWELPFAVEIAPTPSHITSDGPGSVSGEPTQIWDRSRQPSGPDFSAVEPAVTPTEFAAAPPSTPLPKVGEERIAHLAVDRLIGSVLCIVWLGGTVLLMLRAARRLVRVYRWQSRLREINSPELIEAAALAAPTAGLRQPVRLRCSPSLPAPVSFGLLRPCIVVPEGIEGALSDEQLRAVLQHESAHLARGDLWVGLLQQLVQTLYWWNPLVRSVNRHIGDLREQICDDIAVQHLSEPVDYASILVQFAERACGAAAIPATLGIGASPPSQLEGRVRRLIAPRSAIRLRLTRWAVAGVLSLLAGTTAVVGIAQIPPEPLVSASAATPPADEASVSPATTVSDGAAADSPADPNPTLAELIHHLQDWERAYLRSEIHAELNYVAAENLSSALRAQLMFNSQGEKKLYESAILKRGIWREKTTRLVDGKPFPRSTEFYSNEKRTISITPRPAFPGGELDQEPDIYVSERDEFVIPYPLSMPLSGLFNASPRSVADLYADGLRGEHELRLEWDAGDAKLTLQRRMGTRVMQYVHWLSRAHDWHPRKSQVAMQPDNPILRHEWEATRFAREGNHWRIDEGVYRDFERGELFYSVEFKVLKALFGDAVDPKQFAYEIPPGTPFRTDREPEATEPVPLPTPEKTRTVRFTVVTPDDQPIQQATITLRPNDNPKGYWDILTTDAQGMASSSKVPAAMDIGVEAMASGFRPANWGLGFDELRIVMIPFSPGTVLDPFGKPAAKTWITNKELQFRPEGFPAGYPQYREQFGAEWSDDSGKFELQTEVTARSGMGRVRYVAIDPTLDQMAVGAIPIREMGRPQQLQLQPVCRVHGHYVAEGVTDARQIFNRLELASGEYIGWLQVQSRPVDKDLHVNFAIRLPAGDYVIRSLRTDLYPGFRIPFSVPADRKDLDLGEVKLLPITVDRLLGQPAPPLDVQWRAGEEQTWESLKGQVVVLDFWGLWCGPCLLDAPEVFQIYDRFKDRPVKWISIHTAELKTFAEFDELVTSRTKSVWKGRSIPFPTVLDRQSPDDDHLGATSRKYGVAEWPTLIVVDQQGTVTGTVRKEDLAARIEHLLKTAEQN